MPFWSRTILRVILKDLPPTQRYVRTCAVDRSANGSASVQQLYQKRSHHLLLRVGGRDSLQDCVGMPSRNDGPPSICDTHGKSGNVFVNPTASSSVPSPRGFNPWISHVSEHMSPHVMSERQTPDTTLDPRCLSGPSTRNSFDLSEGRFSKNHGADQQRLQISDLHFDKFPNPTTFACWKIRFKT